MSVSADVAYVKDIPEGTPVSYGSRWVAGRATRLATIPLGYADGVPRTDAMREAGAFVVKGARVPVAGTVCMDLIMVDVTDVDDVKIRDEAVIIGKQGHQEITAEEVAAMLDTISYEVLCGISARVPREYIF